MGSFYTNQPKPGSAPIALSADYTVTMDDDGKRYYCTTALVITYPVLTQMPEIAVDCPPTGNLTIRSSGGVLLNGATADLTRTRTSNPCGIVVTRHYDASNSVGVSGA